MLPPPPDLGNIVSVRRRHYLVHDVVKGDRPDDATLVRLHCIDDDAPGAPLEVLWELEIDPRVIPEDKPSVGAGLDEPRMFGAYLNALRWNCVSSTDKTLLQSPFRAGIDIKPYQLEPLRKALDLPRVNLFIADDVGLGKTIEAGLILQELMLRQRVDRVLVVCPPAVTLQWKEELEQRFGLSFALYDRDFVAARRRERGWSINPWRTHSRFIVSYAMLRGGRGRQAGRTQHLQLLLSAFAERQPRSLLILDEAHQVAPAGSNVYAIDTRTTHAIRQIYSRFEHRLFLSATPHNGHSNSFSSLLHMLDPQRFTPGVPVSGVSELEPVMVRRLKRDLRSEVGDLPERKLLDHLVPLAPTSPEVVLGTLLERYEVLYRQSLDALPTREREARALVCVGLHKRLLSSIAAFSRTLEQHAKGVDAALARGPAQQALPERPSRDAEDDDRDEEALDQQEDEWVARITVAPHTAARAVLTEMREVARRNKDRADGRLEQLAAWINTNLCPGGVWNGRRVVVFTEYDDTLRWMRRTLKDLLLGDTEDRVEAYTGTQSDINREALKKAFNTDPSRNPVRILLATDAAREGINLQAYCHDLFHFDLPWNPSRVEQRNGRIDRTLQPAPVVYCHYFDLPDRPGDKVLAYMVRKIGVITEELGSLSDVLSSRIAARMEAGIRGLTPADIERLGTPDDRARAAVAVLESRTSAEGTLRGDLKALNRMLTRSQAELGYRPDHLREAVDLGLRLSNREKAGLVPSVPATEPPSWALPALDESWNGVLDAMREDPPPPKAGVPFFRSDRRKGKLKPVAFSAAHRLDADTVQLHLGHPLVKRLLARFLAQGFSQHDLHRCTVIGLPGERLRRVVAFGRLVIFGPRASRLHESIVEVSAQILPDGSLRPFADAGSARTLASLAERLADGPPLHADPRVHTSVRQRAGDDFLGLWATLKERAAIEERDARAALARRADEESAAMAALLDRQEEAIRNTLLADAQQRIRFDAKDKAERDQFERDMKAMVGRLDGISTERTREPAEIRASYAVTLRRFEPVGLVYLFPEEAS
jgi:superfamily II DNA or RNA helicase